MKGTIKLKKRGNKNLRIAMIGHKVVPSRRGGIERVLTIMCPLMIKKGHQVTCFNRSGDKVENEYVKTVKRKKYRGVQLKKVITINKRGLAAMTSSFSAAKRLPRARCARNRPGTSRSGPCWPSTRACS